MQVVARRVDVFSKLMPKLNSNIRLVGFFIFDKPHVFINPHKRTAAALWDRIKIIGNTVNSRGYGGDEVQGRVEHITQISTFIFFKPLAVVVLLELPQKTKRLQSKTGKLGHR